MESTPAADPSPARPDRGRSIMRLRPAARTLLIAGIAVALVAAVLLAVVLGLDAFNAAVYSMGGDKNINDATAEAQALRDQYAGVKAASIVGVIVGLVLLIGSLVVLYLSRPENGDDGEDLSFDELAGE
ncbi:hypothetical protein [Sinomonas atrocyanea]|uniref:hypothetical protein n=1 Tax=Sinomonas atrocyanea TaxID=37927 RepID=UPI003D95DA0F